MDLSEEAIERLARIGYNSDTELQRWRDILRSEGEPFLWRFIQKYEATAVIYRRWSPKLREYAAACRQANPTPMRETFTTVEREQYRVLYDKMVVTSKSGDGGFISKPRPNSITILSTTPVGLTAAAALFGDITAVILTREESDRWFSEICPPEAKGFGWYALVWWSLDEELPDYDAEMIRRAYPIPEGSSYWIVQDGVAWGSLAGGSNNELWCWDGQQARYIETYSVTSY